MTTNDSFLCYYLAIFLLLSLSFPSLLQAQKSSLHIRGISIERYPPSCYGKADGSIYVTLTDDGTYSFLWSNGGTTNELHNIEAGIYFVTITSKSGKQMIKDVTLRNPNRLFIRDYRDLGGGKFEGIASGGSSPYSYASGSTFVIGADAINEENGGFEVIGGEQMEVFHEQITSKIRADVREKAIGKVLIEIPYVMVTDIKGCSEKKYLTIKKDTIPTLSKPVNDDVADKVPVSEETPDKAVKKLETVTKLDTRFGLELPLNTAEKVLLEKIELALKVAPAYKAEAVEEEPEEVLIQEEKSTPKEGKTPEKEVIPPKPVSLTKEGKTPKKEVAPPKPTPIPKLTFNERKIPETLGERSVKAGKRVQIRNQKVELLVWDSETVDGDTISLYFNGEWLLQNYSLKKSKKKITLQIDPNGDNYLVLYAHNEGTRPPNTAALTVIDGKKERRVGMSANLKVCDSVHFKLLE